MKVKAKRGIKINSQRGDGHINGTFFSIIGKSKIELKGIVVYFVLAKDFPLPIAIMSNRVDIVDKKEDIIELSEEQMLYINNNIPPEFIELFDYEN